MSRKLSLPIISDKEDPFIKAILAAPEDEAPRLIYSDWLDEHDDIRAEYLRIDCALAKLSQDDPRFDELVVRFRELHFQVDRAWRTAVARTKIENCVPRFDFRCPKNWDKLELTGQEHVRYCSACRKQVIYCDSIVEARRQAVMGKCVAVDPVIPRSAGDLSRIPVEEDTITMGMLEGYGPDITEEEARAQLGMRPVDSDSGEGNTGRKDPWWRFWS
jgi:uncharacterized protein (TIGR02996 family)